jgi:hypothetical protein
MRPATARLLIILLLAGCASANASALNADSAAFNQRLLVFQQDYRGAMVDLEYLKRAPGFATLMQKGTAEHGRRKAAATPFRSLDEVEAALWPTLTDAERDAVPGTKAWITNTAAILGRGRALDAERVEIERRRGEVAVAAMRQQELYQGLSAALATLNTIAILTVVSVP